jgi:hypothetical protein
MVENATDARFYLFPLKYPNSAHYKMLPTELQIQGCETQNKCEEVMECERAVVDVSDTNLDESVVFISWKLERETFVILMQYKNRFIKCRHYKPHLQIQKLVMFGSQMQRFGIVDGKSCGIDFFFSFALLYLDPFLILVIQAFLDRLHKQIII